ncbi:Cd(II)/Pb(II)-responsive transcriptional regulator [Cupriavidus respiraculi]|uniref:HTH-type transcriptional regulator ZntR n=1 Tax=Cupriavidus respiraculi TaxID=195930 RepID=A0ABN7ZDV8_9BURK|nr:Cd(II)/Pb(II)-responsive transcriptional regulator [Cupriavidus respiraculi]MBY4949487.1 Cd(II)/Pb(II)-responsive transcriptional regulator [Cupriavidus respiraculi]CAG9183844.1 HTH-type transcriptional regulator ZntR [Cupriavidus respiraculi]
MKIGELARASGTTVETVRFYEHEGLLPSPARSNGNYRIYAPEHLERVAFIRHCRSLDMTLDEVRVLLNAKDAPNQDCGEVNVLLDSHIAHVAHRIRELQALERDLKQLRGQCGRARVARDCGILDGLVKTIRHAA